MDYVDPFGMFQWLYDVLLAAEANGELVHIVSHAPPGDHSSVSGFGRNFNRVLDRFANTVMAHFYGHTHNDEFELYYDYETNTVPISVGFVCPSVTTYTGLNPSYRIYHMDGPYERASMRIIDMETFVMDMTKANREEVEAPSYYKLYEARKDLGMENLFPEDYDKLARRLVADDALYAKFFRYFNSDSTGDEYSKEQVICTMLHVSYVDDRKCDEILGRN